MVLNISANISIIIENQRGFTLYGLGLYKIKEVLFFTASDYVYKIKEVLFFTTSEYVYKIKEVFILYGLG